MSEKTKLRILSDTLGEIEAEIIDKNPNTVMAILKALPFQGKANVWGEEIYFDIPVDASEEDSQQEMGMGDIAFWPPRKCNVHIFWPYTCFRF